MTKTIHNLTTAKTRPVPFDDRAKESLSSWIILNLNLHDWEHAAHHMAAWVRLAIKEKPTVLSEVDWDTVHYLAVRQHKGGRV